MITDIKQSDEIGEWHFIALKSDSIDNQPIRSLSRLLFYFLGCLHSIRTDNALKNTKEYVITIIIVT